MQNKNLTARELAALMNKLPANPYSLDLEVDKIILIDPKTGKVTDAK